MHISANMPSLIYAPVYTGTSAHTYKHMKANKLSSHSDLCCLWSVCLLVLIGGQKGCLFIFAPTVPRSSAERALKLCIIKNLLALKYKQSLSTKWLRSGCFCPWHALLSTCPLWLSVIYLSYPWCVLHTFPQGTALFLSHLIPGLLRTIVRHQFPSSIFSPGWPFTWHLPSGRFLLGHLKCNTQRLGRWHCK